MSELDVYVLDEHVGVLREDVATGLTDFEYRPATPLQLAVSLVMPPGEPPEEYRGYNGLPPPFEVSLPEGMLLEAIRSRFGKHVDVDSDFSLLRLVGKHTVGRVTFGGPLERDKGLDEEILEAARSEGAARHLAAILRRSPHLFGVAGVMPKMSVHPHGRARPGTVIGHGSIVKFDTSSVTGACLVEYACLKACAAANLTVPPIELAPDLTSIVIERFDIDDTCRRLGFEDACALSGIRRTGKYSGSIEHLFLMIENFVHPAHQGIDRRALLTMIILNDVLRNGDAHLKNFGLVYGEDLAQPRLAPVYDVLTTQAWLHGDTPALSMLATDSAATRWLDSQGLKQLQRVSGLPDVDLAELRDQCAQTARKSLTETLDSCPPCPERNALSRALRIVEKAAGKRMRGGIPRTKGRQRSRAHRTGRAPDTGQS
ncbi:MAG: type II toxin-antitoxin system HipA family toxin [Steroidobacteraceae bacterium]